MLLERSIVVSYETIRRWAIKFGADYVGRLKRRSPSRGDIWRLDEVVISINGEKRYLWRAVDQEGHVLDEIAQIQGDTKAARRLLTRLLRKQGRPPKRIITDKLGSYAAAKRGVMSKVEHRSHKGRNNRAENSHVPIRKTREDDAGFSILAWIATVRLDFFRRPKPLSSHLALNAPRTFDPTFIVCGLSRNGYPSRPSPPVIDRAALLRLVQFNVTSPVRAFAR